MSNFTITAAGIKTIEVRVASGELLTLSLNGSRPDCVAREQIYALATLAGLPEAERARKMDQAESLVRASMQAMAAR